MNFVHSFATLNGANTPAVYITDANAQSHFNYNQCAGELY